MIARLKELWEDESGISAVEYALIATAIALVVYNAADPVGDALEEIFGDIETALTQEQGGQ